MVKKSKVKISNKYRNKSVKKNRKKSKRKHSRINKKYSLKKGGKYNKKHSKRRKKNKNKLKLQSGGDSLVFNIENSGIFKRIKAKIKDYKNKKELKSKSQIFLKTSNNSKVINPNVINSENKDIKIKFCIKNEIGEYMLCSSPFKATINDNVINLSSYTINDKINENINNDKELVNFLETNVNAILKKKENKDFELSTIDYDIFNITECFEELKTQLDKKERNKADYTVYIKINNNCFKIIPQNINYNTNIEVELLGEKKQTTPWEVSKSQYYTYLMMKSHD